MLEVARINGARQGLFYNRRTRTFMFPMIHKSKKNQDLEKEKKLLLVRQGGHSTRAVAAVSGRQMEDESRCRLATGVSSSHCHKSSPTWHCNLVFIHKCCDLGKRKEERKNGGSIWEEVRNTESFHLYACKLFGEHASFQWRCILASLELFPSVSSRPSESEATSSRRSWKTWEGRQNKGAFGSSYAGLTRHGGGMDRRAAAGDALRCSGIKGGKHQWRVAPGWWPCSWPNGTSTSGRNA